MTSTQFEPAHTLRPQDLIGTWQLVSNRWLAPDGTFIAHQFGPEPLGQLIYTADGMVCAVLGDSGRGEATASSGEGFLAYTGTWELRGDKVIHHVLIGSLPSDTGRDRIRTVLLNGNDLTLRADSRVVDGTEQIHEITWRRITSG
jgi:hypothetical protein